jgi:ABC-type amino acid transport substrate-binding protein
MILLRHYIFCSLLLTSLLAGVPSWAEEPPPTVELAQPQLLWCLDHFSRFHNYEDAAEPYGASVDLMRELARRAGVALSFTPRTAPARCFRLMAEGKADLMSNLRYSKERDDIMFMLRYNKTVPETLFLRYDDKRIVDSSAHLRHLTLVSIRGYLYSQSAMTFLAQHSRQVMQVNSIEAGLEMVLRRRVDGLISPTVSTTDAINTTVGYTHRFRKAGLDFSGDNNFIHIGLSRASPHATLEPLLRQHLKDMIEDGTVARLYDNVIQQPLLAPMESSQNE